MLDLQFFFCLLYITYKQIFTTTTYFRYLYTNCFYNIFNKKVRFFFCKSNCLLLEFQRIFCW